MQFVLCPQNKGVLCIRVSETLPNALPSPESKPGQAAESTHGRVTHQDNCSRGDHNKEGPPQITPNAPGCIDITTTCHGRTKGA